MKIITNACRKASVKVTLKFENVKNDDFKVVDSYYRRINGFDTIVCHFVGKNSLPLADGNDSFPLDFECKNAPINLSRAYIVWWNDDQKYNVAEMEAIILKIIADKIIIDIFENSTKINLTKFTSDLALKPRQGGNGGVVSIQDC